MSKAAIRVARPQGGRGAKFDSEHREKRVFTKNLQQPSAIRIPISRIRGEPDFVQALSVRGRAGA